MHVVVVFDGAAGSAVFAFDDCLVNGVGLGIVIVERCCRRSPYQCSGSCCYWTAYSWLSGVMVYFTVLISVAEIVFATVYSGLVSGV